MSQPKFRIYPSIGIARMGNGPATKDQVIFSPEVPWENLYDTKQNYITEDGALKKQAQRFYIYECDDDGKPICAISAEDYDIHWSVEVANKKPFWYDFNNSLDLSVVADNQNLSPNFVEKNIAPGVGAKRRNPNVLDQGIRQEGGYDYRKELVNSPDAVAVSESHKRQEIRGKFPFTKGKALSMLAKSLHTNAKQVNLGTAEYDDGTLIFYPADGISASLNPSDLNTDFADNSNWYDDICDGRITATIKSKDGKNEYHLTDAESAAWVASAPPDYAPQIQPISTMFDLVCGAANDTYTPELSLVFPMMYRLYRMQWVNLGDFLSPSFKETMDKLAKDNKFKYIYDKGSTPEERKEADEVREMIFKLFRNPIYNYDNEPIIPSKDMTNIDNRGSGTQELKLPYYPGDGIDYPGSPAQWFAIPPMIYDELKKWKDGEFETPDSFKFKNINQMGRFYRKRFKQAAKDEARKPLLMTRAVLETLYGGGFHPGVELTWPMRHDLMYAENKMIYPWVSEHKNYTYGFYGLREIRLNTASPEEQKKIYYNDFGFQMDSNNIKESMKKGADHWLWKTTPGDLTKWMGIPWQSDAGSCQAVFVEKQYPIPSWWAANLPVQVLPEDAYQKLLDPTILLKTKHNIYASRLAWLHTTDTGFIGYHAEGGYMNGLINMVYKWKDIGVVTGRKLNVKGLPKIVYVAFNGKQS
ncbi:LodA/GoxA family CTQ-dependent oxidase [uncultured Dokdonia sp.]|uniref:LodA/GoxA family CTQ-dependent oxidase n=1 Tax=uncultured Dokdonia sp. TaxID=575653 RepID=UPI00261D3F21|nr:LodA/GoxA family CTQ-dependent oxidase [uncultured Dokdonia sp.]